MRHDNHEAEPHTVDEFVVLDLDRTLLDSDRVVELMCRQLTRYGIPSEEARENQRLILSAAGQSLSALEFLSGEYGEALTTRLAADLQTLAAQGLLANEALLYGGASPALLDELERRNLPFAVLTYGEPANQLFKLALYRQMTGRDERSLPAVVTDQPKKGEWIHAHWYDGSDEHMRIPTEFTHARPVVAKRVVVLDDKLSNLFSPDKVVQGIHIDNRPEAPSGRRSVAEVVEALRAGRSFTELARHFDKGV